MSDSQKPSANNDEPAGKTSTNSQAAAVKVVAELAKLAMRGASPLFKFFVFGSATAAILIVLAAIVLFRNHPAYALAALIIAVLPILLVTRRLLALIQSSHLQGETAGNITWHRVVLDAHSSRSRFQPIGKIVEGIRKEALEYLRSAKQDMALEDAHVRANVFVPDCLDARDGYAFRLYMPKPLQKRMDHPPEWDLRFGPGEGSMGFTFLRGARRITFRRDFSLTDGHTSQVHEDLKWIVSLPLKDAESETTLAVLSIDGLVHEFDEKTLDQMADALKDDINHLQDELNKLAKVTVNVSVSPLQG